MVSRDVEFDEEATWNWEGQEEKAYKFLPYLGEGLDRETTIQDVTPSRSPLHHLHLMHKKKIWVKDQEGHEIYVKSMKGMMKSL